ncbi:SMP-30/gluconolactonase/LRE family protein [Gordonia sp. (in: high G+C Gram-positive bacteria)]|uniref:SMP-30/gluconolactonase/LRE family protein n=1 Tax=Gordonia sp. (in: high G+C Gram-positive bacteria) TaxID=84139 RepID=UPI003F9839F4
MHNTIRRSVASLAIAGAAASGSVAIAAEANATACGPWTRSTVASNLGTVENLGFDGRGSLLVSSQTLTGDGGSVLAIEPGRKPRPVVKNVGGPAGIAVTERGVFVATGSTAQSGLLNRSTGTVTRIDTAHARSRTVVRGLVQPNGLVALADGRFVTSRDIGSSTGLSIADPATGSVRPFGPRSLSSTNGLAMNEARTRLYVSSTFTGRTMITALDLNRPDIPLVTYTVPGFGPANSADDLTVGPDGGLYIALNAAGRVVRVDPRTGHSCTVADRLPLSSSVRFGSGPGWDRQSLYVTSFLGTVTRLTPMR